MSGFVHGFSVSNLRSSCMQPSLFEDTSLELVMPGALGKSHKEISAA